jgi:hypothetical protein
MVSYQNKFLNFVYFIDGNQKAGSHRQNDSPHHENNSSKSLDEIDMAPGGGKSAP